MQSPRPGTLVISLDFELYWGVRDARSLLSYADRLLGARRAIPAILELFDRHQIHGTWATVGLLFCHSKQEALAACPSPRPGYARSDLSPYPHLDTVGAGEDSDPFHFAPSLIDRICRQPNQEIGTHTFSHFYCLEDGQDEEAFEVDLQMAIALAARNGIHLRSLVFPRNQVNPAYLNVCRRLGLTAYRGNPAHPLYAAVATGGNSPGRRLLRLVDAYVPISGDNSYELPTRCDTPANIPASRFLRPYCRGLAPLEHLRRRRICSGLASAARSGRVYHLWWHPHNFGAFLAENLAFLDGILREFRRLRDVHGMESLTMGECATRIANKRSDRD
ncbi:MAG: polysaccharide deacetylase family protein [Bryobacteraceae bacterium]